ncbi:MAG: ABC transporter substrate-binding protein [Phormidesmis sp.]
MATLSSAKLQLSIYYRQLFTEAVVRRASFVLLFLFTALTVVACSSNQALDPSGEATEAPETMVVLWDKGYVPEEDDAIKKVVADWQAQGGFPINLSFYNSGETAPKTLRASQAGRPPDVLFAAKSAYPVSDWEGKLADVTDVVAPMGDSYTPDALQAAKIYGSEKAQDRYYAVPLSQATTHIYYWKDLLAEAGFTPEEIPREWDEFWSFWKTVQSRLTGTYPELRSIGLPYSVQALDTYQVFDQVLIAYDVKLLDEQGNLRLDEPGVKAGIVQCLNWYLQFYREGYVPDDATTWLDPENNRNFLDRNVVMAPNPTLSIPAAVRNDEEIYFEKLGTLEFPNKPSGEPLPHLVLMRLAVAFEDSPSQVQAKAFLSYLIQPEVLSTFLKTAYGRFLPAAVSQIEADSFWQDPADPHISTAIATIMKGQTQPFYNSLNPAYGVVMEENVWGQAIYAMAAENMPAEAAAEQAIEQIKTIFRERS